VRTIIYLKSNLKRNFAVKIETNWIGRLKSWSIRDLNSKNENFHQGHPNIKTIKKFKGTKLVSIAQGTPLFPELYGPKATLDNVDTSEIIESISNTIE
jgi:hypothetical protein